MPAKRAGFSPLLCMALSALLVPRSALPALPPASVGSSTQSEPRTASPVSSATNPNGAAEEESAWWQKIGIIAPRYALYGSVGYEWFRNSGGGFSSTDQGLASIVGARFNTYLWEPWFGRFFGDLRLHVNQNNSQNSGSEAASSSGNRNIQFSGNGRVSLMYRSRFPLDVYFDRTYSRTTAEFSPVVGSALSTRYGFTQSYTHENGATASLDWNRSTQGAALDFGGSRMDALQLTLSHHLPEHSMSASLGTNTVTQNGLDSRSRQTNVALSHNYSPEDEYYTVDTSANINTSGFRLQGANSDLRLTQISSVATYRPEEDPYTITASVRALGLASDLSDPFGATSNNNRKLQTTNLSLGMTYTLSADTYASGSVNFNSSTANDKKLNSASEAVSITHSPQGTTIGDFVYRWSTTGSANHATEGNGNASAGISLQLSHSLSHNLELDSGGRVNFSLAQGLSAAVQSRRRNAQEQPDIQEILTPKGSRRVTHNAGVSWSSEEGIANTMIHAGYSDSRSLTGPSEVFQMLNLQFTGNIQPGGHSTWTGSIAIQATKQDLGDLQISLGSSPLNQKDVTISSNGSLSYRNGRLFGVRRLTLNSSVRMSSSALLPMLGGATDYETAAWDTRLDYTIGRMILRANAVISRNVTPVIRRTTEGFELTEGEARLNKSIMFTVTRTFGY
ncbi:hypothetical protein [Noviherbaspirillum sp. ST9]|uniref:hypothetical protein n=1 Tax=Noviherbaspirillum sp. ST9 TaxID=3401606 RepID=UPI003B58AC78